MRTGSSSRLTVIAVPFDADAQGTVPASGAGMVTLKRYEDAVRDGDSIYAVIRGAALNNDGANKVGYTAPSVAGQAAVIATAHALADVGADTIGLVEAHGTATRLGDPIEVAALTRAFRLGSSRRQYCALGSLKSNIGHTDAAAGVAGLMKAALALRHRQLPPSLHFSRPNPEIDLAASPFFVSAELRPWETEGAPRRAGVSAFGLGGTNAHVVLEEAPVVGPAESDEDTWRVLPLAALSSGALDQAVTKLADHLQAHPEQPFADVAFTLQEGRTALPERRVVVAQSREEAVRALSGDDAGRVFTGHAPEEAAPVAFLFPGGGAQYPAMGRGLYETELVYREAVDAGLAVLERQEGLDLRPLLFSDDAEAAAAELERPSLGLPALLVVEIALARLWMSRGVRPAALIGHSMGEYAAAHLAGVMTLKDALALVTLRGRLFETLPAGADAERPAQRRDLQPYLADGLELSVVNAPELCVVSGLEDAVGSGWRLGWKRTASTPPGSRSPWQRIPRSSSPSSTRSRSGRGRSSCVRPRFRSSPTSAGRG